MATVMLGCGSQYTIIDRSTIRVSDNARISAQNLVAYAAKYPSVIEQLALAQEVYQQQLFLLKERRNKLRSRQRYLNAFSFGSFALTTLAIGGVAIAAEDENAADTLRLAGAGALGGLAVGTIFQVASFMQEDTSSLDTKVRQLDLLYDTMIERLRQLALQAELGVTAGTPASNDPARIAAEMGVAIEAFITEALSINIKG